MTSYEFTAAIVIEAETREGAQAIAEQAVRAANDGLTFAGWSKVAGVSLMDHVDSEVTA